MSNYIGNTPVLKPLSEERVWVQWFSAIGDALSGRWGQDKRQLEKTNIATEPNEEYLNYRGRELTFLFVWEDGIEFNASTISLSSLPGTADLTMRSGMLNVWDGSTLIGGAYCKERTIELPNLNSGGRIIVEGSVMTKTTDPRRNV